ncbi:MAG: hypothetical protein FJ265_01400 [Planctomycetes bacterium]|nr:hypothetical protein [Planctomycetota bacterium]
MHFYFYLQALVFFVLCVNVPAQRIWRVHSGGAANCDFTDLPAAVAAASPGDTIWLLWDSQVAGAYSGATINKPLTVLGVTSYGGPGSSYACWSRIEGLIEVVGIPAGSRVVLANLAVMNPNSNAVPYPPHGIRVADCAGTVLLEGVKYTGMGYRESVMRFERCADVTLRNCTFELSGEAVTVVDSTMLITECRLYWENLSIWVPQTHWYLQTDCALRVRNSHVTTVDSILFGADQQIPWNYSNYYCWPAAYVESGTLDIGPPTVMYGGLFGSSEYTSLLSLPGAVVRKDPRATVRAGNLGQVNLPIVYMHATMHSWLRAGEPYRAGVAGPPGGFGLMAVGSALLPPVALPPFGPLAMDPGSIAVLGLQALHPQTGWADWARQCPLTVPIGHVFAFQAAVLAPDGTISLTIPSPFTIQWPIGIAP